MLFTAPSRMPGTLKSVAGVWSAPDSSDTDVSLLWGPLRDGCHTGHRRQGWLLRVATHTDAGRPHLIHPPAWLSATDVFTPGARGEPRGCGYRMAVPAGGCRRGAGQ